MRLRTPAVEGVDYLRDFTLPQANIDNILASANRMLAKIREFSGG